MNPYAHYSLYSFYYYYIFIYFHIFLYFKLIVSVLGNFGFFKNKVEKVKDTFDDIMSCLRLGRPLSVNFGKPYNKGVEGTENIPTQTV